MLDAYEAILAQALPSPRTDELAALVTRAQRGDRRARELVIRHTLRFVAALAARRHIRRLYRGRMEDALAVGMAAVDHAITKFDPRRKIKFLTYAKGWIKAYLRRAGLNLVATVHVPETIPGAPARIQLGNVSLDERVGESEDATRLELLPDTATDFATLEARDEVRALLSGLTDRERRIVVGNLLRGRRLSDVGEDLGVSGVYAGRLAREALIKIANAAGVDRTPEQIRADLQEAA